MTEITSPKGHLFDLLRVILNIVPQLLFGSFRAPTRTCIKAQNILQHTSQQYKFTVKLNSKVNDRRGGGQGKASERTLKMGNCPCNLCIFLSLFVF